VTRTTPIGRPPPFFSPVAAPSGDSPSPLIWWWVLRVTLLPDWGADDLPIFEAFLRRLGCFFLHSVFSPPKIYLRPQGSLTFHRTCLQSQTTFLPPFFPLLGSSKCGSRSLRIFLFVGNRPCHSFLKLPCGPFLLSNRPTALLFSPSVFDHGANQAPPSLFFFLPFSPLLGRFNFVASDL